MILIIISHYFRKKTKLVSLVHVSNTLGCINPVTEIITSAREKGAKVLIDACQSLPHLPIDVQGMDCDWLVGSGHKMCATTGIGFLYGKEELLEAMPLPRWWRNDCRCVFRSFYLW